MAQINARAESLSLSVALLPRTGESTAAVLETAGQHTVRYGLVLVLAWIGAMKFTAYEANGINLSWRTAP